MQRVLLICLVALLAGGTLGGCSQDGDASSSASSSSASSSSAPSSNASPSTTAAVCSSVDELQRSVAALRAVPVVQEGVSAVEGALAKVRSDVTRVVQDAQSQYAPQIAGLTADVAAVQTAVSQAQATPSGATLNAVAGSIRTLSDDVTAFAGDVSSTC
jgi:predicted NAD/FAD-binding protein